MPRTVRFTAPRTVDVVEVPAEALAPGTARVATLGSGISAGTELTAYRGTNPYLTSTWDPGRRLFTGSHPQRPSYPLVGWGYSEVGRVVEAVLALGALRGHRLPEGLDPVAGCFVRVGAIALNAVLAADAGVGETVAVVGQGVIGLLATCFAALGGARVVAVEGVAPRRERALALGAAVALEPGPGTAAAVRELTGGRGADAAVDLSGSYRALHEATRLVGADGRVVAAGFYQGEGAGLRLGEEFHHNRVEVLASQIGAVPARKRARWDVARLQETVVGLLAERRPDVTALVSHRFAVDDAAQAYRLLDAGAAQVLQVVLDFPAGGRA
ncbi:zinc-dependent alcohol dehydrogenase [Kineococcus indalonis]|uniref:zinc-dependent alcohol dehydrogenase n=1 Tax=Kineococcus indalonis TaxID=2696566 RepID=UPI001412A3F3|nr:zinc-binding alcohol dehydrogenase [Kineococcus indalonis]NAZ85970.1 zinc-binding dehydrogenase [Kineococcus indalonis]